MAYYGQNAGAAGTQTLFQAGNTVRRETGTDELNGMIRPVPDPTVHTQCKGTPMLIVNTLCQSH